MNAARAFRPDLVHAWSPRLAMVAAARQYACATGAPLVVHWEDDEWSIRTDPMRRSRARRVARAARSTAAELALPAQGWFATPGTLRWIRGRAAGHDALTPALAAHVSQRIGRPCSVVLPISPHPQPTGDPPTLPAAAERGPLLLYTGSVHPASEIDLEIALRATAEVQARGYRVSFAHAGSILPRYRPEGLAAEVGVVPGTIAFLGYLPFAAIPPLLRRAAILLQPGMPTDFNRLRVPSKLQAYLASGVPTVTFSVGFGELLADREEVLKTYGGEPSELAERIIELLEDGGLRARLARGGPAAARRLFDRGSNGDALERHYRAVLRAAPAPVG